MTRNSVAAIVQALDSAQVRYLIAGGLAVVAHGYVSRTQLIAMKRSADRPQDLADIQRLEADDPGTRS